MTFSEWNPHIIIVQSHCLTFHRMTQNAPFSQNVSNKFSKPFKSQNLVFLEIFFSAKYRKWCYDLLFISYKFVKGFLAITFLLLVTFSWNFHNVCQRFLYNQKWNFSLIRQKTKSFPIDNHYKNRPLYRHDVTKVGDFYNRGLWENFSFFVGSN